MRVKQTKKDLFVCSCHSTEHQMVVLYSEDEIEFDAKINCFVGANGVGKTNILDAIYYLSFTKSYFNSVAIQNIRHGEGFFMVEGDYLLNDRNEKIVCSLKKGQKKVLKRNGTKFILVHIFL